MSAFSSDTGGRQTLFATLLASQPAPDQTSGTHIFIASAITHIALVGIFLWFAPVPAVPTAIFGVTSPAMVLIDEIWGAPNLSATPKVGKVAPEPARRRRPAKAKPALAISALPMPALPQITPPVSEPSPEWIDRAEEELQLVTRGLADAAGLAASVKESRDLAAAPLTIDELKIGPTTTPYTLAPELLNRDEIVDWLNRRYPPDMKALGRGGLTTLWLLIDQEGRARKAIVHNTSGHDGFDAAALDAVSVMKFRPAENTGRKTAVWVQLPVRFQVVPGY